MSKYELKELALFLVFTAINVAIAYLITTALGIQNIVLFKSITAMEYVITYEVIILLILSFIEATFYHFKYELE